MTVTGVKKKVQNVQGLYLLININYISVTLMKSEKINQIQSQSMSH